MNTIFAKSYLNINHVRLAYVFLSYFYAFRVLIFLRNSDQIDVYFQFLLLRYDASHSVIHVMCFWIHLEHWTNTKVTLLLWNITRSIIVFTASKLSQIQASALAIYRHFQSISIYPRIILDHAYLEFLRSFYQKTYE